MEAPIRLEVRHMTITLSSIANAEVLWSVRTGGGTVAARRGRPGLRWRVRRRSRRRPRETSRVRRTKQLGALHDRVENRLGVVGRRAGLTRRISVVAVCSSSASFVSLNRRTFSIAMTAWAANVFTIATLLVGEQALFVTPDRDDTEEVVLAQQWNGKNRGRRLPARRPRAEFRLGGSANDVEHMKRALRGLLGWIEVPARADGLR